jgi:hypothetical protein
VPRLVLAGDGVKAAPLRSAASGRTRTGLRPWGPTRHGAPGS